MREHDLRLEKPTQTVPSSRSKRANLYGLAAGIPVVSLVLPLVAVFGLGSTLNGAARALHRSRYGTQPFEDRWPPSLRRLTIGLIVSLVGFALSTLLMSGRGWPRVEVTAFVVFGLTLAAVSFTTQHVQVVARILALASLTTVATYVVVGNDLTQRDFVSLWKYGIGTFVAILLIWWRERAGRPLQAIALLLAVGVFSLVQDFRSLAIISFTSVILALAKRSRDEGAATPWGRLGIAAVLLGVLVAVLPSLITSGTFGTAVAQRTAAQTTSTDGPVFLAGRVEPPLSAAAIVENPLLGAGQGDTVDPAVLARAVDYADRIGLDQPSRLLALWVREDNRVSYHSILLSSWAIGGVLAFTFPFLLVVHFVRGAFRSSGRYRLLTTFVSVQGIWDLLFSPWADNRAAIMAISALLVAVTISATSSESS